MSIKNFRCREIFAAVGVAFTLTGCAAHVDHGVHGDFGSGGRSSSSGRSTGINVGLGILGAGVSAIAGSRSDNQEQKSAEKKDQTAEEAEKAKSQ